MKISKAGATLFVAGLVVAGVAGTPALADPDPTRINHVDTTFRLLGRNDRIVIDRYDDPKVDGVSCYMSRAETGGSKAASALRRTQAVSPSRAVPQGR